MRPGDSTGIAARGGVWQLVAAWLPVVLWVGLITWLSSDRFSDQQTAAWLTRTSALASLGLPPAAVAVANLILRKTAHLVEYAVLGLLIYRALASVGLRLPWARVRWAVALAASCAMFDEVHQTLMATRTGTPKDVVIDTLGACLGALLAATIVYGRGWWRGGAA
ncbi:MAG: VanZ family protein [Gemmatimonadaceae bacterium]